MDPIAAFPDAPISDKGPISQAFTALGLTTFMAACQYVQQMPYGYNTTREDPLILFRENRGSCTTKHMAVGLLAAELNLPVDKHIGIYAMGEPLVTGAARIAAAHGLPYIPVVHCFLSDGNFRVDLTEGNQNGKNGPIDTFLFTTRVRPDISEKEEYRRYRQALQSHILTRTEMTGIDLKTILQAREAALALLKVNMERQQAEAS
jgi:1-acyl-sn-glycerol-3-phosphate acyltransferase